MWGLKLAKCSTISYLTLSSTMSKFGNSFLYACYYLGNRDGNIYLCCLRRVREIGQMFHYLLCHASNILSSKITPKLVCAIVNKHYFTNYLTLYHSVMILISLTFQFVSVCFSSLVGNGLLLIPRVSL